MSTHIQLRIDYNFPLYRYIVRVVIRQRDKPFSNGKLLELRIDDIFFRPIDKDPFIVEHTAANPLSETGKRCQTADLWRTSRFYQYNPTCRLYRPNQSVVVECISAVKLRINFICVVFYRHIPICLQCRPQAVLFSKVYRRNRD
jgi:hypothetical protein